MSDTVGIVLLVLLGVLVGAAVPVLLQLRRTLRTAETFLEATGRRLDRTLDETTRAAERINRFAGELESGVEHARALFDAARELGETVHALRDGARQLSIVGSAIGPALSAAIQAFLEKETHEQVATEVEP